MAELGEFRALTTLRAKKGELNALDAFDDAGAAHVVQPLLEVEVKSESGAQHLPRVEAVIRKFAGLGRVLMVDVSNLGFDDSEPGRVLAELTDRLAHPATLVDARDIPDGIGFIPVVRGDAPDPHLSHVGSLCAELGAGAAVRLQPPTAHRAALERVVRHVNLSASELDVIVDFQYVDSLGSRRVGHATAILADIRPVGPFRSLTVLSGSIPRTLEQTATWQQARIEEELWMTLAGTGGQPVRFGDYGVVHPGPGVGFHSKHVNVKYTCPANWLYLRERVPDSGVPTDESPRASTFRRVCQHLVDDEHFAGADFSWGDRQIQAAADGGGTGLGDRSTPVCYATSHHLTHLAYRPAA